MNQVVKLETSNARINGIVPRSLEEIYKISETIFKSGLAPQGTRSPDQVAVSIMHGLEIGLPPMQSVQKVAVINGRPALWGDAVPALLWSKGFKLEERFDGAEDKLTAVCIVTRPCGAVIERRFSVDDAKRARLWGKPGPWQQYPNRMLQMRARSFAARDGASEVLCGLYLAEEAQDIPPPKDITPSVEVLSDNTPNSEKDRASKPLSLAIEETIKLQQLMAETGADEEKFLKFLKVPSIEAMTLADYDKGVALLEKKLAKMRKEKQLA